MAEMTQETDYPGIALSKLVAQYKDSSNLISILDAQGIQANELEQAIFEVRDLFFLETAGGVQLDVIGKIFGLQRMGLSDNDYETAIEIKWSLRVSGTVDDIIGILEFAYGATATTYTPAYPAGYVLETNGSITQAILEALSPAGVFGFLFDADVTYWMDHEETLAEDSDYIIDADGFPIIVFTDIMFTILDAAGDSIIDAAADEISGLT